MVVMMCITSAFNTASSAYFGWHAHDPPDETDHVEGCWLVTLTTYDYRQLHEIDFSEGLFTRRAADAHL